MMGEAEMDSTDFGPGDLHDGFPVDDVGDMPDYSGDPGPEDLAPHEPGAEAGYPDLFPAFPGLHSGESWPAGGDDLALASPTEPPVQDAAVRFGESDVSAGPHTIDVPADPVTPIGPDGNGWDPVAGEYVHNDYPGSDIYTPGKNPA
jgi:hypothetical protein